MTLLFCFDNFDPVKGQVPDVNESAFHWIAQRARQQLQDMTSANIHGSMEKLTWLIRQGEIALEVSDLGVMLHGDSYDSSYSTCLKRCMDQYDLYDDIYKTYFTVDHWHKYFAILSLAIIGKATNVYAWSPYPRNKIPAEFRESYVESCGSLAADAMHAVCIAESLIHEESIEEKVRTRLNLRFKKSGYATHRITTDATELAIQFYDGGEFPSILQATKRFIEKFPEKVSHLSHERCEKTMYDRLRKALKERASKDSSISPSY